MVVGGEGGELYTYLYTVATRMIPALRWTAMTGILMFSRKWWTKSQDSVHNPQPFSRERSGEAVSNRGLSAYQPNALPLGQTGLGTGHSLSLINYINPLSEDIKLHIITRFRGGKAGVASGAINYGTVWIVGAWNQGLECDRSCPGDWAPWTQKLTESGDWGVTIPVQVMGHRGRRN